MSSSRNFVHFVGLICVVAAFASISGLSYLAKWERKSSGFTIKLKFSYLNNLSESAPVKLAGGIIVGSVDKIYQDQQQTYVDIYIDNSLKGRIPNNRETQFAIYTDGIIGKKYINLSVGDINTAKTYLKDGDVFTGTNPASIDQLFQAFSSWFDGEEKDVLKNIFIKIQNFLNGWQTIVIENDQDIKALVRDAREVFSRVASWARGMSAKLKMIAANLNLSSKPNQKNVIELAANLKQFSGDLSSLAVQLEKGNGSMARLMLSKSLKKNSKLVIFHAQKLWNCVNNNTFDVVFRKKRCI